MMPRYLFVLILLCSSFQSASAEELRIPIADFTGRTLGESWDTSSVSIGLTIPSKVACVNSIGIHAEGTGTAGTYTCLDGSRYTMNPRVFVELYPAGGAFWLVEEQAEAGAFSLDLRMRWLCIGPDDRCEVPWTPDVGEIVNVTLDAGPPIFIGICGPEILAPLTLTEFELVFDVDFVTAAEPTSWSTLKSLYSGY